MLLLTVLKRLERFKEDFEAEGVSKAGLRVVDNHIDDIDLRHT